MKPKTQPKNPDKKMVNPTELFESIMNSSPTEETEDED